jgi:hypothetical protein
VDQVKERASNLGSSVGGMMPSRTGEGEPGGGSTGGMGGPDYE